VYPYPEKQQNVIKGKKEVVRILRKIHVENCSTMWLKLNGKTNQELLKTSNLHSEMNIFF
jgi:ribosomal protein L25 (general stress protein Ctc)